MIQFGYKEVSGVYMAIRFSFDSLTNNDDNYWRIDWFGYTTYQELTAAGTSKIIWPHVKVFVSPVRDPEGGFDLNRRYKTQFINKRGITVPIEYLCLLRLGDVWHKGALFRSGEQNHVVETFENVIISKETVSYIQAGSFSSSGNPYLHYANHIYHKSASLVNCLLVKLADGTQLLIPGYVVAQTYFSASSYVFSELFRHGLTDEMLYDRSKSSLDEDGNAFIHLKQRVPDNAASQVARIAFDENARKAAALMTESLVMYAQRAGWYLSPKVDFPFIGRTDLQVYGKRCPGPENVFIVFGILGCSAKFPFNHLRYFRDAPGDENPDDDGVGRDKSLPKGVRKSRPEVSKKFNLKPKAETNNSILNSAIAGRDSPHFSYLDTIVVEKERVDPHLPKRNPGQVGGSKPVDEGNAGRGSGHGTAAPVSFEAGDRFIFPHELCRLERFRDVFTRLSEKDRVLHVSYRKVNETSETVGTDYSAFPEIQSSSGFMLQWPYSNYIRGVPRGEEIKPRRRMVAIIEVVTPSNTLYLFESQRRGVPVSNGWVEIDDIGIHLIQMYDNTVLSDYQLQIFLESSARSRGQWGFPEFMQLQYRHVTLKHPEHAKVLTAAYEAEIITDIEKFIKYSL